MTAFCPTRCLFFSPFCVAKQAFTTCVQWGPALSSPCRWCRCRLPAGLRPRCAARSAQSRIARWRCPAQAARSRFPGLQWSRWGPRRPTRRLWPEHCMMKLHGCSTAAPATSFALPCAELLARQRACTARATRLALVSARSRIAAALRVTPVCRIVAAHEHVRHRPVMCMYKTNFLSELQSQPSFSIDPTRTRSLWRKNLTRCNYRLQHTSLHEGARL